MDAEIISEALRYLKNAEHTLARYRLPAEVESEWPEKVVADISDAARDVAFAVELLDDILRGLTPVSTDAPSGRR